MSAHPSLLALGKRLQALGHLALGQDVAKLGSDLASEGTTLRVLERLVGIAEQAAHADRASGLVDLREEVARLRRELATKAGRP